MFLPLLKNQPTIASDEINLYKYFTGGNEMQVILVLSDI